MQDTKQNTYCFYPIQYVVKKWRSISEGSPDGGLQEGLVCNLTPDQCGVNAGKTEEFFRICIFDFKINPEEIMLDMTS